MSALAFASAEASGMMSASGGHESTAEPQLPCCTEDCIFNDKTRCARLSSTFVKLIFPQCQAVSHSVANICGSGESAVNPSRCDLFLTADCNLY